MDLIIYLTYQMRCFHGMWKQKNCILLLRTVSQLDAIGTHDDHLTYRVSPSQIDRLAKQSRTGLGPSSQISLVG